MVRKEAPWVALGERSLAQAQGNLDLLGMGQRVRLGRARHKADGQFRNIQVVLTSPIHFHPFLKLGLSLRFNNPFTSLLISVPALVLDA